MRSRRVCGQVGNMTIIYTDCRVETKIELHVLPYMVSENIFGYFDLACLRTVTDEEIKSSCLNIVCVARDVTEAICRTSID